MSVFITKPYYQQVNEINDKLMALRQSNMDILKDQLEGNTEITNFTTETKSKIERTIKELEAFIQKSIIELNIISSITAYDSSNKRKYGKNTVAYTSYKSSAAYANYKQLKTDWEKHNQSVADYTQWQKDHLSWQKNEARVQKYAHDRAAEQHRSKYQGETAKEYKDRMITFDKTHKQPKSHPEPVKPIVLPAPATPVPPKPLLPNELLPANLENISLTTIPQIIDFRKAFAFFTQMKFSFAIVYDDLLQFDRFLNKENTKILKTLLKNLGTVYRDFLSKFFFRNADGDLEQLSITAASNYGKNFKEVLEKNVYAIYKLFDEYYPLFTDIVSKVDSNQVI